MHIKPLHILAAIALIAGAFIWKIYIVPSEIGITTDFRYKADVISFDNFFDTETDSFLGPQRSVTTFLYAASGENKEGIILDNVFDVRTPDGESIVTIQKEYIIDGLTRAHTGTDSVGRTGFLFAPPEKEPRERFMYWHPNYNDAIELVLVEVEDLEGLRVTHYRAVFTTDQTQVLTHLPGVPEERGLETDVELDLWFEPETGRLIHYSDMATVYYYEQESGERLHPWNSFSNTFTADSVREQVNFAKEEKKDQFLVGVLIPGTLGVLAIFILLLGTPFSANLLARIKTYPFGIYTMGAGLLVLLFFGFGFLSKQDEVKVVGLAPFYGVSGEEDENLQGFKQALADAGFVEGENLEYVERYINETDLTQQQAAKALLESGVDLIFTRTTPGTLATQEVVSDIPVVFSTVVYPAEAGIVRTNSRSDNNFVGVRYYVPPEEQILIFESLVGARQRFIFVREANETVGELQVHDFARVAQSVGFEVVDVAVSDAISLQERLENTIQKDDAVYVACGAGIQTIVTPALFEITKENVIPVFACAPNILGAGAIFSAYPDSYVLGYSAGQKAATILAGVASPGELRTTHPRTKVIEINQAALAEFDGAIPRYLRDEIVIFNQGE